MDKLNAPWTAKEKFEGWTIIDSQGNWVASGIDFGRDMGEGTAKLLAATPALLKALKELCTYVESKTPNPQNHWAYEQAREAIASAE